ncbi:MAG: tandem-95 repeat protein [Gammaproteobacteria bacterium]|nr:tandem-95 repeat protein [Gammaproteobacteria bacterium]
MANFELNSKCSVKHHPLVGICSILGVCLLLQTGCSRGPNPVALEFDIEEDTSASIILTTTETSDREVSYQISTFPEHGSISGTPPNIYYSPPANYFGSDEFEYVTLRRNGRVSKPATVKIDIAAVNDPPVAEPIQAATGVNMVVLIDPQAIDVDGQVVDYQIATPPGYGKVELNGAKLRYTPSTGFLGNDSFEYVAIDESGLRSANARVTVRVSLRPQEQVSVDEDSDASETVTAQSAQSEPVTTTPEDIASTNVPDNSLPVVEGLDVVMLEDSDTHVELKATDTDGTISRFGITTLPAYGTLSGSGSKRTYKPSKDFFGTDSFAYVAIDDQGGVSQPAVVSIPLIQSMTDLPRIPRVGLPSKTAPAFTLTYERKIPTVLSCLTPSYNLRRMAESTILEVVVGSTLLRKTSLAMTRSNGWRSMMRAIEVSKQQQPSPSPNNPIHRRFDCERLNSRRR